MVLKHLLRHLLCLHQCLLVVLLVLVEYKLNSQAYLRVCQL
jgi:hypothetical protein